MTKKIKKGITCSSMRLDVTEYSAGQEKELTESVERACQLSKVIIEQRLKKAWKQSELFKIESSVNLHPYKKVRDIYGKSNVKKIGYYPSRFERVADEQAGRLLLAEARKMRIIQAMLQSKSHEYLTPVEYRSIQRSVSSTEKKLGYKPRSAFKVSPQPPMISNPVLNLCASDNQFHKITVHENKYQIKIKLPICDKPAKTDWVWRTLTFTIPGNSFSI